jgi:uncharacterized protein (TIGR02466 family)
MYTWIIFNMPLVDIWPTWVYSEIVAEHDQIYQEFLPFVTDKNNFTDTWTFGNCLSSIRNPNNDSMPWGTYFDFIKPHVDNYLMSLEPTESYSLSCDEYWANIYYNGHFQESHDHSFSGRSLSAIYILEVAENQEGGDLVFECPMYNVVKYTSLNIFKKWNYQHFVPKLVPGLLMIFPSWISHYVLPLTSESRRISLATNFKLSNTGNDFG